MSEITFINYQKEHKKQWDDFIDNAKNSHFMFKRDYIEYHSDRFKDNSYMFFKNNKLIALLPCNIIGNELYSHQGLTFGGFISDKKMRTPTMIDMFQIFLKHIKSKGITNFYYKAIPHIYHNLPAEEDIYCLFINNALLKRCDVTTSIYLKDKLKFNERRKRAIKKAQNNNLTVKLSKDYNDYWKILNSVLGNKYNTKAVHSLEEITHLAENFSENIRLFASYKENKMLAGVIIYENKTVAHAQYIASSEEGKQIGALDIIFEYLINEYYANKQWFDFGISNENEGKYLNKGLINQKEDFGARAVAHKTYEIKL